MEGRDDHIAVRGKTLTRSVAAAKGTLVARVAMLIVAGTLGTGLTVLGIVIVVAGVVKFLAGRHLERGMPLGMLLCAAGALGGINLLRWCVRRLRVMSSVEHSSSKMAMVQQRLLGIASVHGGRITAAELAASLNVEPSLAVRVLDEAVQKDDARLLFSADGVAIYEFTGLVARKIEAREPWDL